VISFRSHVASLVAVFLALAVGIVLGGGPLQRDGGGGKGGSGEAVALAESEAEVARLRQGADFDDEYARATRSRLVPQGMLRGRAITLVTLPTADEDQVTEIASFASSLGASVAARVSIEDALSDVANRQLVEELGSRLRAGAGDTVDVPSTADGYERLGRLLGYAIATDEPGGAGVDDVGAEILASLTTAQLVTTQGAVKRRGSLVVVVAGGPAGTPDQRRGAGDIVSSLAAALDASAQGAVVVGPISSGERDGVVGAVRRSRAAGEVSTVDVIDRQAGVVLSMLALAGEEAGTTRHLGTARAEDGAFPQAGDASGDTSG
jgi:hypothetical protein